MPPSFTFHRWLFGMSVLTALFGSFLHAQTPDTPKPARLRFLFLDETAGAYSLKIDRAFKSVSSGPYTISPPYTPGSLAPLDIYKTSTRRDPETGEFPRIKVTSFTPPSNLSSALVIITPQPSATDSLTLPACRVEIIDNSPATFPGGSLRILNRGQTSLAVSLSGDQIIVEPATNRILAPVADARGRLRVLIAVQTPDQWKLIDDNVAVVTPETRITGVLVYSPSGMKFRLGPYLTAERGDPPPSHVWLTYTDTP
jgi:hypothetical protein